MSTIDFSSPYSTPPQQQIQLQQPHNQVLEEEAAQLEYRNKRVQQLPHQTHQPAHPIVNHNNNIANLESTLNYLKCKLSKIDPNYGKELAHHLFPFGSSLIEKIIFLEKLLQYLKIAYYSIKLSQQLEIKNGNYILVNTLFDSYLANFQELDNQTLHTNFNLLELFNNKLKSTLNKYLPQSHPIDYQLIIDNNTTPNDITQAQCKQPIQPTMNFYQNEQYSAVSYDQSLRVLFNNAHYSYLKGFSKNEITISFNVFKCNFYFSTIKNAIAWLNQQISIVTQNTNNTSINSNINSMNNRINNNINNNMNSINSNDMKQQINSEIDVVILLDEDIDNSVNTKKTRTTITSGASERDVIIIDSDNSCNHEDEDSKDSKDVESIDFNYSDDEDDQEEITTLYECDTCFEMFLSKSLILKHLNETHNINSKNKVFYNCNSCKKSYCKRNYSIRLINSPPENGQEEKEEKHSLKQITTTPTLSSSNTDNNNNDNDNDDGDEMVTINKKQLKDLLSRLQDAETIIKNIINQKK